MRTAFVDAADTLLHDDPRTALVLADISAADFGRTLRRYPDRAVNVGIREQLMVSVAGGMALSGLRPIAHSYAPFLIERAWEQVKLDLSHQGVGAILVSVGGSYDASSAGRTHQSPGDVALIDTLAGWTVHVPGHAGEVGPLLRAAVTHDRPVYIRLAQDSLDRPYETDGRLLPLRHGTRGLVVAVGPVLAPVLEATVGLDLTVAYTNTPRPWDIAGTRALAPTDLVVVVEPYLAGTSAHVVSGALADRPHRLISLGASARDRHRYGTPADHQRADGLDPAGLRAAIATALDPGPTPAGRALSSPGG
jgi:transketolase